MPHYLGDILVVKYKEIVPKYCPSYTALRKRVDRHKDLNYGPKQAMGGGKGRKFLLAFDSLDEAWQKGIGDPRINQNPLQVFYKEDKDAAIFYSSWQYPDGSYLTEETKPQLEINASVLTALTKLEQARYNERIAKTGTTRDILKTLFRDAMDFNHLLAQDIHGNVKHSLNTNYRYFRKQYTAFKEDSYVSLIKDAEGNSKLNALKIDDKHAELLNNMFAGRNFKPNKTQAAIQYQAFISGTFEVVNVDTSEIYNPKEYKELSVGAITNHYSKYEHKIGNYAKRSGDRQQLMQEFIPYESLEQPVHSGSIISIDDRQPPFWYEKGSRMWWYIGIDLASQAIVGWAYGKTKQELILNFYRNLVVNCHKFGVNMPHQLECELSLNSSFKNNFLRNGAMFQDVQIHPNSARSKRIERYFRDLRYGIEKEQEGWIARPFAKDESNQAASDKPNVIIHYDDLVNKCFQNIITWNNMPCNQDKSVSRFDYFINNQHKDLKPTNWKAFMYHLGKYTQSSCKAGFVKLQGKEWCLGDDAQIYTGENLIRLLKQVEARQVNIHWLSDDNTGEVIKALLYTDTGRYVGEILPKPIGSRSSLERSNNHLDAKELMARYRATITSYMANQQRKIDKVETIDHRSKTISNSFSIEGYENFVPRKTPAKAIDETPEETIYVTNTGQKQSAMYNKFFDQ